MYVVASVGKSAAGGELNWEQYVNKAVKPTLHTFEPGGGSVKPWKFRSCNTMQTTCTFFHCSVKKIFVLNDNPEVTHSLVLVVWIISSLYVLLGVSTHCELHLKRR